MEIGAQAQSPHVFALLWFSSGFNNIFFPSIFFLLLYLLPNFWPHAYFLFHFSISFCALEKCCDRCARTVFFHFFFFHFWNNINTSLSRGRLLFLVQFISMISSTKINKFSPCVQAFRHTHTISSLSTVAVVSTATAAAVFYPHILSVCSMRIHVICALMEIVCVCVCERTRFLNFKTMLKNQIDGNTLWKQLSINGQSSNN